MTQHRADHTPERRAGSWAGRLAAMVRPPVGRDPVYPVHAAHLATPCRQSSCVAVGASQFFIVEWCRCGISRRSCRLRSPIPSIDPLIEFTAQFPVKQASKNLLDLHVMRAQVFARPQSGVTHVPHAPGCFGSAVRVVVAASLGSLFECNVEHYRSSSFAATTAIAVRGPPDLMGPTWDPPLRP